MRRVALALTFALVAAGPAIAQQCNPQCQRDLAGRAPAWDIQRQCCAIPRQAVRMKAAPVGRQCRTAAGAGTLSQPGRVGTPCACRGALGRIG